MRGLRQNVLGAARRKNLPWLRAARAEHEKEQALERRDDLSVEQSTLTEDDEEDGSELNCSE